MKCQKCDTEFEAYRCDAKYCSTACRVAVLREKRGAGQSKKRRGRPPKNPESKAPTMKKKSTSHVVQLKERTKERIRKAQGPSSTPSAGSDIPVTDVPPAQTICPQCGSHTNWSGTQHPDGTLSDVSASCPSCNYSVGTNSIPAFEDATAGMPPEALPETPAKFPTSYGTPVWKNLPVEHHDAQNELARQIIAKVPAPKLDPNSEEAELARLLKHQMPVKKKGGE